MVANPLDIITIQAAPVNPGLFDGQLPSEGPSVAPAQTFDTDPEEVQVGGAFTQIIQRVIKGTTKPPVQRLEDVPVPGAAAGQVDDYIVVREASNRGFTRLWRRLWGGRRLPACRTAAVTATGRGTCSRAGASNL
jgi:hypothetical protein